jgi:hypothetical protein
MSLQRRSSQCCSSPSPGRFVVEPDPSLRSTPEIRVCERCGTETRWRRRPGDRLEYIDVAPPAHLFRPRTQEKVSRVLGRSSGAEGEVDQSGSVARSPLHSRIVQANRARACALLPSPVRLAIGYRA